MDVFSFFLFFFFFCSVGCDGEKERRREASDVRRLRLGFNLKLAMEIERLSEEMFRNANFIAENFNIAEMVYKLSKDYRRRKMNL